MIFNVSNRSYQCQDFNFNFESVYVFFFKDGVCWAGGEAELRDRGFRGSCAEEVLSRAFSRFDALWIREKGGRAGRRRGKGGQAAGSHRGTQGCTVNTGRKMPKHRHGHVRCFCFAFCCWTANWKKPTEILEWKVKRSENFSLLLLFLYVVKEERKSWNNRAVSV